MLEGPQFSLAPKEMRYILLSGERLLPAGEIWLHLLEKHTEFASGVVKVYGGYAHRGVPEFEEVQIVPRELLVNFNYGSVPAFAGMATSHNLVACIGSVFDTEDWGQRGMYNDEHIYEISKPAVLPFLDFEYPTSQYNLESFIAALKGTATNWYMLASGGGSVQAIIDRPIEPAALPEVYSRVITGLLPFYPTFDNEIYRRLFHDLQQISADPGDAKYMRLVAGEMLSLTGHFDETPAINNRVFPLDLRYIGHSLERLAEFLDIQGELNTGHRKDWALAREKARMRFNDSIGISYLRLQGKYSRPPYLIAMSQNVEVVWRNMFLTGNLPLDVLLP